MKKTDVPDTLTRQFYIQKCFRKNMYIFFFENTFRFKIAVLVCQGRQFFSKKCFRKQDIYIFSKTLLDLKLPC